MSEKIAVLGASGFVGSMVLQYMEAHSGYEVTPFAGSTGGATALAHQGRSFKRIDLLDKKALQSSLADFDCVINCSRGGNIVMEKGFENLLEVAAGCRMKKLVHISSVAVYGDPPHPDSVTEDAPTTGADGGYGAIKRDQDEKLQKAAASGLGAIILCPPNIIGPYSEYLLDIIESIERGRFRLVHSGQTAVNVIDVNALAAVILKAVESPIRDGRRLFVNHPERITWRDLCDALEPVLRTHAPIPPIDADVLKQSDLGLGNGPDGRGKRRGGALKHLISEEVREALKKHPTWAALESAGKSTVRVFGGRAERYVRRVANGPIRVPSTPLPDPFDRPLVSQQLRRVKHRPDRCLHDLSMELPIDFRQSMQHFNDWYRRYFDADSDAWQLLGHRADCVG